MPHYTVTTLDKMLVSVWWNPNEQKNYLNKISINDRNLENKNFLSGEDSSPM